MKQIPWHIITGEYPPQPGGVSDYTELVATGLANAGDEVHVWCPAGETSDGRGGRSLSTHDSETTEAPSNLFVHREFGRFAPADLRRVGRALDRFPGSRRLLVQWVAQGFGYRSINLPFCLWLWRRAKFKGDRVELMVHEPFLAFGEGTIKQDLAAAAHRLMVTILLHAASRVWVSIPDWEKRLRPFVSGNKRFDWLPVPSSIAVVEDPNGVAQTRNKYTSNGTRLIGHFGAYDEYLMKLMLEVLPSLENGADDFSVLLIGKGSVELRNRLIDSHPQLSERIHASGTLESQDLSRHISACDVMLQPYQDGVSGRRTSAMTALAHGIPVVTTAGRATEDCWAETVRLAAGGDAQAIVAATRGVLADDIECSRLSRAGKATYESRFDICQTVAALRQATAAF